MKERMSIAPAIMSVLDSWANDSRLLTTIFGILDRRAAGTDLQTARPPFPGEER
jgi:hypothetical protein